MAIPLVPTKVFICFCDSQRIKFMDFLKKLDLEVVVLSLLCIKYVYIPQFAQNCILQVLISTWIILLPQISQIFANMSARVKFLVHSYLSFLPLISPSVFLTLIPQIRIDQNSLLKWLSYVSIDFFNLSELFLMNGNLHFIWFLMLHL